MSRRPKAPNGSTSSEPLVGHGQLAKALNELEGVTDARFRVAMLYLAHTKPPDLSVYVKTETIARKVGRSKRHVERVRSWLRGQKAIRIVGGGGRGRSTLVDFTPLAKRINRDSMESQFRSAGGKTATGASETATPNLNTATENAAVMRRTLPQGPLPKDRADARAHESAHAARRADPAKAAFYAQRIQRRLRGEIVDEPAPEPLNEAAVVDVLETGAATGTNGERS